MTKLANDYKDYKQVDWLQIKVNTSGLTKNWLTSIDYKMILTDHTGLIWNLP